jgi:hypothetical protein
LLILLKAMNRRHLFKLTDQVTPHEKAGDRDE